MYGIELRRLKKQLNWATSLEIVGRKQAIRFIELVFFNHFAQQTSLYFQMS